MPLTLTKEDGTGNPAANTYALAADGDAYHDGHLYASAWTGAVAGDKDKALVMATRLIDGLYQFNGFKRFSTQALQWPRRECRDPDNTNGVVPGLLLGRGPFLDETKVPVAVVSATCEFARELIKEDRTDDPDGEGLAVLALTGTLSVTFDKSDRPPVIPQVAQAMLAKLGEYFSHGAGVTRLVRV